MRETGGHQVAGALPGTSVEDSGDRRHQEVTVVRYWRSIVQVRRAENHRSDQQTGYAPTRHALDPVLNQPAKQEFFRQGGEKKDPDKLQGRDRQL